MIDVKDDEMLVGVACFETSPEAHLAAGQLEAEGIDAVIADETLADMHFFYSAAGGGVRVLVRTGDAVAAAQILGTTPPLPVADDGPLLCPACGGPHVSHRISVANDPLLVILLILLPILGWMVLLVLRWRWRCDTCGHAWRDRPAGESGDA